MPTSTVEDYLKCVCLEEQRRPGHRVSTGRIAEILGLAPGTVTSMLKTLAENGLADYEPYSGVLLLEEGRRLAIQVLRRHRLVELFLVQVMGFDWSEVHAEAERLEHAVSERLIDRMDEMLGFPAVDPHGDPIPDAQGVVEAADWASLLTCKIAHWVEIRRVGDQSRDFLRMAEQRGLVLGCRLQVENRDETLDAVELVLDDGQRMSLGSRAASKIFVQALGES